MFFLVHNMTDFSGNTGRFSFNQKFLNFWDGGRWHGNFLGKFFVKSKNCRIFWNSNVSAKNSGKIKSNGTVVPIRNFWKFGYTPQSCPLFITFTTGKCQTFNSKWRDQMECAHFRSWNVVKTSTSLACVFVNIYMLCFLFYLDPWKTEQSLCIVWCKQCKEP